MDAPGESWLAVDMALYHGTRGLPGGSSLAQLLKQERGRRAVGNLPYLSVKMILSAADAHFRQTGAWPQAMTGSIPEMPGEKWYGVEWALRNGFRGLPGGSSLYQLLVAHGRIHPFEPRGLMLRRLHAGFSRPGLAARVGVSYGTVVIWEQGWRLPQPQIVAILAGVLGLPVEKLREEMQAVWKGRRKDKRKSVQ
jgi:DNA-binding XRE family transcriptional regulator